MSKQPRTQGKRGAPSVLSQELGLWEVGRMGGVRGLASTDSQKSVVVSGCGANRTNLEQDENDFKKNNTEDAGSRTSVRKPLAATQVWSSGKGNGMAYSRGRASEHFLTTCRETRRGEASHIHTWYTHT